MHLLLTAYFLCIIPTIITASQWDGIVDDIRNNQPSLSYNNFGLWRGGNAEASTARGTVRIRYEESWFCEVIARENECLDVSGKALVIHYFADKDGFRTIEFHQKSEDCSNYYGLAFSIKVMFSAEDHVILLPPTLFKNANLARGHAFVIKGPIEIASIKMIDAWDPYLSHINVARAPDCFIQLPRTTLTEHVKILPEIDGIGLPIFEVLLSDISAPMIIDNTAPCEKRDCVDLRGKLLLIEYSTFNDQGLIRNPVSLQFKPFNCENSYIVETSAEVPFPPGSNQYVYVSTTAFRASNLMNAYKVRVSGPIVVHSIIYVDDPTVVMSTPIDLNLPAYRENELLIDDFTLSWDDRRNNRGFIRAGSTSLRLIENSRQVNLVDENDSWTEHIGSMCGWYKMQNKGFRITYSSTDTTMINLTLLQWNGHVCGKRKRHRQNPTPEIKTSILFFAGIRKQVIIPITAFAHKNPTYNPHFANGLIIHGPLTLYCIEIVDDEPLTPTSFEFMSFIPSEVLIGFPIVLCDFMLPSQNQDINTVNAVRTMGYVDLPTMNDSYTLHINFDDYLFDPIASAFRITYSASNTSPCILSISLAFPYKFCNFRKPIVFERGTHKQLIIPFTTWKVTRVFDELNISGPLSIHRIELVTTLQYTPPNIRIPRPTIIVTRNNLFMDAYNQRSALCPSPYGDKFSVRFHGENGVDNGGLSREFFTLISREFSKKSAGLFIPSRESNYRLQINPDSRTLKNSSSLFNFVGRIIGVALLHNLLLESHFTPSIFKLILNKEVGLNDLKELDPKIYESLERLKLDNNVEEAGLTMSAEYRSVTAELVPGGNEVPVTKDNIDTFMHHYAQWRVHTLVQNQIQALRQGLLDVISTSRFKTLKPDQFASKVTGLANIDVDDWKRYTTLEGYTATDVTVELFWKCMAESTNAERRMVLQFVTGCTSVPTGGFASLRGDLKFKIFKSADRELIPSSHTCFNQLDLPPYQTMEELQKMFRIALSEPGFSTY